MFNLWEIELSKILWGEKNRIMLASKMVETEILLFIKLVVGYEQTSIIVFSKFHAYEPSSVNSKT